MDNSASYNDGVRIIVPREAHTGYYLGEVNQIDETDDTQTDSYLDIVNLLWIESHSIHKKALQEWERKESLLSTWIEKKQISARAIHNEIYQLVGFLCIFQGIILTAVAQNLSSSSSAEDHSRLLWRLGVLLLSCAVSLLTIASATIKIFNISELRRTIRREEEALREVNISALELRRCGELFKFSDRPYRKPYPRRFGKDFWANIASFSVVYFISCLFPLTIWAVSK